MKNTKADEEYEVIEEIEIPRDDNKQINYRKVFTCILWILSGFCLSRCDSLSDMSPFFTAFICSMPFDYCCFAFLGGSVGYFIAFPWQIAAKYTVAAMLAMAIRMIIYKRFNDREGGHINEFISFLCLFTASAVHTFITNFSLSSLFVCFCEAVLCLCSTYFFLRFFRTPVFRLGINSLSAKDSMSLVISLCIFLLCLSSFTVEQLSPGRILACMLVIFSSLYKGTSFGAVTGVCVGAALCINPEYRFLFPAYALGGVVSGVFSSLGQISCTVAFAFSFCICCLMGTDSHTMLICVVELAISCGCFMIIPAKWLTRAQDFFERSGIVPDMHVNRYVCANLHKAANNIYDVAGIVNDVSDKLDTVINPEVNKFFSCIQQKVCDGCEKKNICWNKRFDETAGDILTVSGIESIATNNVQLQKRCPRFPLLTAHINESYPDYANSMATKMKARELRRVLTDQFNCVGDFLTRIAQQVSSSRVIDPSRSTALRNALIDTGIYIDALSYFTSENSMVTIEITILDKVFEVDHKKMKTVIEFVSGRRFEKADISVCDTRTTISFTEKMKYRLCTGFAQSPVKGQKVCGDSYCRVTDENAAECVIISDGMGTGSRAYIDSTMTVGLMHKLLSSGFSFDSSVKLVNSCLIMRSTDESFATIDALCVNLYSGVAEFHKAGAAISFIRRENNVSTIEKASLPIGIIRNAELSSGCMKLEPGDIVLLVSDGATAGDCGWISDELLAWNHGSMENLASHIVSLAKLRNSGSNADDITAAAIKMLKNG